MTRNNADTEEVSGIEKRTKKAAVESMSLDRHAGEPGEYDVYSSSGSVYRVDLLDQSCSCPDHEHRSNHCKHLRRVEMEIGQRSVPDLDRETDVDVMINARADQQATETDQQQAMTDGGVATEPDQTATDGRPEDCSCLPSMEDDDIGCFDCYQAGYETANPNAGEADTDDQPTLVTDGGRPTETWEEAGRNSVANQIERDRDEIAETFAAVACKVQRGEPLEAKDVSAMQREIERAEYYIHDVLEPLARGDVREVHFSPARVEE